MDGGIEIHDHAGALFVLEHEHGLRVAGDLLHFLKLRLDLLLLGAQLGRLAREAAAQVKPRRLVVAGGDTSSYAARALGIESLEMLAPLTPGAPLCRAHAPGSPADGMEINFKGGQVGSTDYFGLAARGTP